MAQVQPYGRFHGNLTVGTTEWFLLPCAQPNDYIDWLMFNLAPDPTGSGYIETTIAPLRDVEAANDGSTPDSIIPITWPPGEVDDLAQDASFPVTAYRFTIVSGTMKAVVRGV